MDGTIPRCGVARCSTIFSTAAATSIPQPQSEPPVRLKPSSAALLPLLLHRRHRPPAAPIPMEFWGVEVKPGQKPKVEVKNDHFLHISQCALSEPKEGVDATMFVKVDGHKLAIGTLTKQTSMFQFDLVFEKDFELSHNSKSSSVCFTGYMVFQPPEGDKREDESVQRNGNKRTSEGAAETPASDEKPAETPASDKKPAETPASDKEPAETPAPDKKPAEDGVETPASDKMPAEGVVKTPPSDKKPKVAKENSDDNERAVRHPKKRKLAKENSADNDRAVHHAEKPKVAKESTGDTKRGAQHAKLAGKAAAKNEKLPKSGF